MNPSKKDEEAIRKQLTGVPEDFPLSGQLSIHLQFFKTPPKATPKWKLLFMDKGMIRPNKSPDLDNYIKLILDALNGIIWEDDRYIVSINASKFYTTDNPRTEVKVYILPLPTKK
ncbi:hypothetical protein LCGC14_0194760 [marine sediment metagenome]|uniref:Uncharacterized protein n=1 Tax=marine sediment metagenome TaxID=412755 RepID=A0A0F9UPS2_9ZZZZ